MTDNAADSINERMQGLFGTVLGLKVVEARKDKVVAEFDWRPDLCTVGGTLHGGALMGLADHAGGTLAIMNLGPGEATTTIESKTNFLRPIRIGDTAHARSTLLHKGRSTVIVQTTITRDDGKTAAIVTQTQLVLPAKA